MTLNRFWNYCIMANKYSTNYQKIRKKYFELESCWEAIVDLSALTNDEISIHKEHKKTIHKCHFSYIDPFNGDKVFTRYFHYLNGTCCGEACRHCTYNYSNVPVSLKQRRKFNSSFWVNSTRFNENESEGIEKLLRLVKIKPKVPLGNHKLFFIDKYNK